MLAKRIQKGVTGEILVNGEPPDRNFKRRIAFVLQVKLMFGIHMRVNSSICRLTDDIVLFYYFKILITVNLSLLSIN